MNLFGNKKKPQQQTRNTPAEAIGRLNGALENLTKREKHLEKRIEKEQAEIKRLILAKNKLGAKAALKRRKMYEVQLQKLDGTRMTIENQKMSLETANFNVEVMSAMSQGAQALASVNNGMSLEVVDETMDTIQEQMDTANEIQDAISQPMGMAYEDEDELDSELAELEAETLDASLMNVQHVPAPVASEPAPEPALDLPDAPVNDVLSEEEKELRALEASMAM